MQANKANKTTNRCPWNRSFYPILIWAFRPAGRALSSDRFANSSKSLSIVNKINAISCIIWTMLPIFTSDGEYFNSPFICMSFANIENETVSLGGIQRLVSTHRRGGVLWTNSNPKSLNLAKFSFLRGRSTLDQLKLEVPVSLTIFISEGGYSGPQHSWNT